MKKVIVIGGFISWLILLSGCSVVHKTEEGRNAVVYEEVDIRDLPEDLEKMIEERKAEPFEITYRDMEFMYIAKGYGKKEESGYCIEIAQCTENEDAIYIEVILHGPGGDGTVCETEYPFCVIRTEYTEKHVVFEE